MIRSFYLNLPYTHGVLVGDSSNRSFLYEFYYDYVRDIWLVVTSIIAELDREELIYRMGKNEQA